MCILGASDAGKSYLARALVIKACNDYSVRYFHSEELLESMAALKQQDYKKFASRMKQLLNTELIILDDFLLHTITEEKKSRFGLNFWKNVTSRDAAPLSAHNGIPITGLL